MKRSPPYECLLPNNPTTQNTAKIAKPTQVIGTMGAAIEEKILYGEPNDSTPEQIAEEVEALRIFKSKDTKAIGKQYKIDETVTVVEIAAATKNKVGKKC